MAPNVYGVAGSGFNQYRTPYCYFANLRDNLLFVPNFSHPGQLLGGCNFNNVLTALYTYPPDAQQDIPNV